MDLSAALLQNLLQEGQPNTHARLAGKLCSLKDSQTAQRLQRLRDFVFGQLKKQHTGLSSHLIPFLNALSYSTSQRPPIKVAGTTCYFKYLPVTVEPTEMALLHQTAAQALDGSLMQEGSIRLISSLVQNDDSNFQRLLDNLNDFPVEELLCSQRAPVKILGMVSCSSDASGNRLLASNILKVITDYTLHALSSKDDPSPQVDPLEKVISPC